MPVPAKKKPLAVGNSISELNSHAENVKISIKTPLQCRQYCNSLKEIFKKAEARYQDGDDENAYILYMRFLHIFEAIKKTYDYQKQTKLYNDLIGVKNILTAVNSAESIAESLKERYKQLNEDRNSSTNDLAKISTGAKKQEGTTQEDSKPSSTKGGQNPYNDQQFKETQSGAKVPGNFGNSLPNVPSFDNDMDDLSIVKPQAKVDPWIAHDELYNLLKSGNADSILILDARPPEEFHASRIKHNNILNIREELLKPGANVNSIERRLPKDVWECWIKRGSMDHIIIMDHEGTRENSKQDSPIHILKDAIFKWDSSAQVKTEPRLLESGFNGWQLYYPSRCTNPFYKKSKSVPHVNIPDPKKLLSSLNYPELPGLGQNESPQPGTAKSDGTMDNATTQEGRGIGPMSPEKKAGLMEDDLLAKLRHQIEGTQEPNRDSPTDKDQRGVRSGSPSISAGGGKRLKTDGSNSQGWKAFGSQDSMVLPDAEKELIKSSAKLGAVSANGDRKEQFNESPFASDIVDGVKGGSHQRTNVADVFDVGNTKGTIKGQDDPVIFARYKSDQVGNVLGNRSQSVDQLDGQYQTRNHLGSVGRDGSPVPRHGNYKPYQPLKGVEGQVVPGDTKPAPQMAPQNSKGASIFSSVGTDGYSTIPRASTISGTTGQGYHKGAHDPNPITQRSNSASIDHPTVPNKAFSSKSLPRKMPESDIAPSTDANVALPRTGSNAKVPIKPGQSAGMSSNVDRNGTVPLKPGVGGHVPQTSLNDPTNPGTSAYVPSRPGPSATGSLSGDKPPTPGSPQKHGLIPSSAKGHLTSLPLSPGTRPSSANSHPNQVNSSVLRPQISSDITKVARADSETSDPEIVTSPGLPHGWEKSVDKRTGRIYFIDHITKSTHWELPPDFYATREKETETKKQKRQAPVPPTAKEDKEPQPSLKRSLSTPNLADLEDSKEAAKPVRPVVDRTLKPSQSKQQVVDRSTKPLSKSRLQNLSPVYGSKGRNLTGLKNLGNTCYMNSVIQCLSSTVALAKYFNNGEYLQHLNSNSMNRRPEEMAKELAFLIKVLWSGQYRSVSPSDFKQAVGKFAWQFAGTKQQDSHEFLMFLMDGIHEDVNKVKKKVPMIEQNNDNLPDDVGAKIAWKDYVKNNNSIIVDLFQGQFRSTVSCKTCGKNSVTFDVFSCLPLQLTSKSSCSLDDCIRAFTTPEMIGGNNSWKCSKCKAYREAKKTIELWNLPPVIVIQLKRFSSDGIWHNKLQTNVDFPIANLDMSRHLVGPGRDKANYELYAVVNHYGSFECGHYTSYCANRGKWCCYDDNVVSDVDRGRLKSSAAYLLFYTSADLKALVSQ